MDIKHYNKQRVVKTAGDRSFKAVTRRDHTKEPFNLTVSVQALSEHPLGTTGETHVLNLSFELVPQSDLILTTKPIFMFSTCVWEMTADDGSVKADTRIDHTDEPLDLTVCDQVLSERPLGTPLEKHICMEDHRLVPFGLSGDPHKPHGDTA